LAFYEGTLDALAYQDILQKKLLPAAQEWYEEKEGWELQDKASCHTTTVHRALVGATWSCGGGRLAH
jgi:hypothetical protein